MFGDKALIQRCTLHKRRNVAQHLPAKDQACVDASSVKAFGHPDPAQGLRNAKHLASQLEKNYPGAAASLREGLEEMFAVARLGIDGRLAITLTTSNPIESMISIARTADRNVTRWRDGQMVLRWTAAGMLNAERSFRRVKGYKQMPQLVAALHRHAHPETANHTDSVSTAASSSPWDRHRKSTRLGTPSSRRPAVIALLSHRSQCVARVDLRHPFESAAARLRRIDQASNTGQAAPGVKSMRSLQLASYVAELLGDTVAALASSMSSTPCSAASANKCLSVAEVFSCTAW